MVASGSASHGRAIRKVKPINIHLGAHYLGQLLNDFQGSIIYSVAAYNAGLSVAQWWLAKSGHRPSDEFVE